MNPPIETATYRLQRLGPWPARAVRLRFLDAPFAPPPDALDLIERTWLDRQAAARRGGPQLYNGTMARLAEAPPPPEGGLELHLQPTDYKTFLATNLVAPERFAPADRANVLGLSAVLATGDGRLVLGLRSDQVAYNQNLRHPIGGVVEWRPQPPGGADGEWLLDQLRRELFEELALEPQEVAGAVFLALACDRRVGQPELLCRADLRLPVDALLDRFRRGGDREHDDLWPCPDNPSAVVAALADAPARFSPIAAAALLAHLATRFGDQALAAVLQP